MFTTTGCLDSSQISVDELKFDMTLDQLESVRPEIDQLSDPPNATSTGAELYKCTEDSGDVSQPHLERKWSHKTPVDATQTGAELSEALKSQG